MTRLPIFSGEDLVRVLGLRGFAIARQRGSHARLVHPDGRRVTVPLHAGHDASRGLLAKILRDAELSLRELASA